MSVQTMNNYYQKKAFQLINSADILNYNTSYSTVLYSYSTNINVTISDIIQDRGYC